MKQRWTKKESEKRVDDVLSIAILSDQCAVVIGFRNQELRVKQVSNVMAPHFERLLGG